jgi:hypothetical protein
MGSAAVSPMAVLEKPRWPTGLYLRGKQGLCLFHGFNQGTMSRLRRSRAPGNIVLGGKGNRANPSMPRELRPYRHRARVSIQSNRVTIKTSRNKPAVFGDEDHGGRPHGHVSWFRKHALPDMRALCHSLLKSPAPRFYLRYFPRRTAWECCISSPGGFGRHA